MLKYSYEIYTIFLICKTAFGQGAYQRRMDTKNDPKSYKKGNSV